MHNQILDAAHLAKLAKSHLARDNFGPKSEYPYIAFKLNNSEPELDTWLKDLPCPIIGITPDIDRATNWATATNLDKACDIILCDDGKDYRNIIANIQRYPFAAMILVQHLRASETLTARHGLIAESLAYAALQNGPEFKLWHQNYKGRTLPEISEPVIDIDIDKTLLNLTLNHPQSRNAMGMQMRDALCDALNLGLIDTDISKITLTGHGSSFSIGGALEEFGQVSDPATAHWIRSSRLPAQYLVKLQHKLHVHVNGAAIGAGAEIAAFGHMITASSKAWFQLPELKYGLIPGAGGTISLPQRIGRQNTAYMALSMKRITAKTALQWGLIDAIIDQAI